mgnify:CR=1 FL=1
MANWWQYLGNKAINKLLLPTINKSLSVASSLGFKPTPKQVSPVSPTTETKNNTKEVKATTLSTPTYNPTANTINTNAIQNVSNNPPSNPPSTPDLSSLMSGLQNLSQGLSQLQIPQQQTIPTTTPVESETIPTTTPVESEADKYFKMYLESIGITPEEEALQKQLSNIITGADLGVAGLEGQGRGIPLSLVRGQQEKLLRQAAIQAQPLQKQLELLQAQRQVKAEMAKAASEYYKPKETEYKPITIGAGETLIDPVTGKVIYQGAPKASDFKSVGAGETLIDPITGKVIYQGTPKTDYSNLKEVQGGLYNMATGEWVVQPKATGTGGAPTSYKAPTQAEQTLATYAARMEQAQPTLKNLENTIANTSSFAFNNYEKLPAELQPIAYRQFMQAARNFINAVLRRESGAVISPTEFAEARKQYLPQPGDNADILAQKEANRNIVYNSFKKGAGSAYQSLDELLGNTAVKPQNQPQTMTLPNGAVLTLQPDGTYE